MKQPRQSAEHKVHSSFIVRVVQRGELSVITVHNLRSKEVLEFSSWEALLVYLNKQSTQRLLK